LKVFSPFFTMKAYRTFPGPPFPKPAFLGFVASVILLSMPVAGSAVLPGAADESLLRSGASPSKIDASDSAPSDKPLAETPGEITQEKLAGYITKMEEDVRSGELERIGLAAPAILRSQAENAAVHALFALHLAAAGKADPARKQLEAARKIAPAALTDLCAEALLHFKAGRIEEAADVCRQAIARDKTHPYPWNILGRMALAAGKFDEAAGHFSKALELNVRFQPAHLNLGVICLTRPENPDPAAAVIHFKEALHLSPQDARAHIGLATALEAQGQLPAALEVLKRGFQLVRRFESALEMMGRLQIATGKYSDAVSTGKRMEAEKMPHGAIFLAEAHLKAGEIAPALAVLQKVPANSQQALLLRSNCSLVQKDYPQARTYLDQLLKLNPGHFGGKVTLAAVQLALGETSALPAGDAASQGEAPAKLLHFLRAAGSGSRNDWKEALTSLQAAAGVVEGFSVAGLSPDNLPGALQPAEMPPLAMGLLLHVQGMHGPAMECYGEAVRLNPDSAIGHYLLASLLLEKNEKETALRHLEHSLARAPKFFASLYALGDLAMQARQADKALEFLQRAHSVAPASGIDLKLGIIFENTNRPDEAALHYRRFIESSPDVFIGYNQLAWLYANRGQNLDEASKLAQKANTLQPGNASVLDTLGWIHFKQGRLPEALQSLHEALKIAADSPGICYHIGTVHLAAGNRAGAREFLEKALKLSPEFPEAPEAKRLLGTLSDAPADGKPLRDK
jgi:tetratricopeptide (TPR) repeat protein